MNRVKTLYILALLSTISLVNTSFAEEELVPTTNKAKFFAGPAINQWAKFVSKHEIILPVRKPIIETEEVSAEEKKETEASIAKAANSETTPDAKVNEDGSIEVEGKEEVDITLAINASNAEPAFIEGDIAEHIELPPYPENSIQLIGKNKKYKIREEDTLLDVARHFNLGFIETFAANQDIDTWTPGQNTEVTLPYFKIIPRTEEQKGIIVNLAQMRLYYFKNKDADPITFPIGIGREGLNTPVGKTRIGWKRENPTWSPTERMLEEKEWLPKVVEAGPNNPLGEHALYLGWPEYLIHGTNKPWAIGRRVSSGCMRMYPKNVKSMFEMVEWNTPVTIVNQPLLIAERDDELYLEANPTVSQGNDIEMKGSFAPKPLTEEIKEVITKAAGDKAESINWETVKQVMLERKGYPIKIN